jgi:hypothetical protein
MVWGCVSYDCKLDLITVRGILNVQIYRQNILEASVSLWQASSEYKACLYGWQCQTPQSSCCDRLLVWRVDNHTSMACQESWFKQIEHIWDIIGRQEKERTPPVQTLNDLEQTVCQEWQRLTQVQIHRLVGSMRRRLAAVIRVNGSYTHYQLFSPDMKFQCLMTLSEYKLCLNDGILDSGINSYQVTFSPPQKWHIFNLTLNFNFWM